MDELIAGIVLAAGAGRRFGATKQLADLDGLPLLEHAVRAVTACELHRVVVVLGSRAADVLDQVDLHGAEPVICDRWGEGQAVSLACGLGELPEADAVVVTLGDQPGVTCKAVRRVLDARNGAPAVRATYGGQAGHPVVIERRLIPSLRDATGDAGARGVLTRAGALAVPCDDLGGGADVDTPDDLLALRMEQD
jgi:CTP:molybdopterin cytidylyltransferase MocA